ncbi:MAG: hypothetical protein H5T64_07500 [Chloroflexi bacterium]|nr:hypothetical protein [Chloroflexota bacterium]
MRVGEIIETSSTGLWAESFELNRPPALGSLVSVRLPGESIDIYAVVSHGRTAGLDPSRHAVRRGTEDLQDERIYAAHPELEHILRTEFAAVFVGYRREGHVYQHLPPQPPPLHFSVHACEAEEVKRFSANLRYLRLLLTATGEVPVEQLLAAHIRQVYELRGRDRNWLEVAAREVAALLKTNSESLMTVLYAIEPEGEI